MGDKPPTLRADWILEHIGNVGVDSGNVMLIDPVHQNREIGVTAPTGGDGIFPVFKVRGPGGSALLGIFIAFESDPPHDADGLVTLGNKEEG
jgi:hypothetical protein